MSDAEVTPPTVSSLLKVLDVEQLDRDLFRSPDLGQRYPQGARLFGGQVAAQALRAATLTVEVDHHPHSLHGYFLRPGAPERPVLLHVDRIRDGKSFTTRRVVAVQNGEAIFSLSSSFHKDEDGGAYAPTLLDDVPDPDDPTHEWDHTILRHFTDRTPLEVREIHPAAPDAEGRLSSTRRVWIRTQGSIPDDRALQACVAAFVSDMGAVYAAAMSVELTHGSMMGASLDHAMWFHRPLRLDEWTLYDLGPVSAGGARGLVRGAMYDRSGRICVSVTQEALIRPIPAGD